MGTVVESAWVRAHEENALVGGKSLAGSRKGAAMVNLSPAEIKGRDADLCQTWEDLRAEKPYLKECAIDDLVSARTGFSARTVRRARSKKSD